MANLPLRNLGAVGVVADANPYDIPPNSYSDCNNVIFDDGVIQRAPLFKKLFNAIKSSLSIDSLTGSFDTAQYTFENAEGGSTNDSRYVSSYADPTHGETICVSDRDGTVRGYPNGELQFITPANGLVTNDNPWTHTQVAGMSVLARQGMVPYIRNVRDDVSYSLMGNDWGVNDTAAIARGYLDYIILMDVVKGGVSYPTMVKWSDGVQYGQPSNSIVWTSDTTNSAGENVLGELKTRIKDGMALGSVFIIYAADQVWLMEHTGSSFVFNFRKLFEDGGVINTNSVVEVDGRHFVFGDDDIYTHDGISKQSIADARVRRKIFNELDRSSQTSCMAIHDSVSNLILFCYKSKATTGIGFPNTQFTNKAAIYNYRTDKWSFMDLPNIVGGSEVNVVGIKPSLPVMLGITDNANGLSESRAYILDLPEGMPVNLEVGEETLKPCWVERTGIDLDDAGVGLPLRSYKTIKEIVPQFSSDVPVTVEVGSSDIPGKTPVYHYTGTFNTATDYKLDMKVSGRYLAYRLTLDTPENFKISGMDVEVVSMSRR